MSASRPINKELFEAGMQCAKRLYIQYHDPDRLPPPSESRQVLVETGERLIELASQAFPQGKRVDAEDIDAAIEETDRMLREGSAMVLFDAAFRGGGAEARADIVLVAPDGTLDLFEVKAGTSVKVRHLADVALQIHAIEAGGRKVNSASVLHLNPRYVHAGGSNYPVQKLFKNVDVTARARKHLPKVDQQIKTFQQTVEDAGNLDLPTGTWCDSPLPCPFRADCLAGGPEQPLLFLPQLTRRQEQKMHESAIEQLSQLDDTLPGLTLVQRRALRAVGAGGTIVEPFVKNELNDLDFPIHFVHIQWHLGVLPRLEKTRPWQYVPYCFSSHELGADGETQVHHFAATGADDPRPAFVEALAELLGEAGTTVFYGDVLEERLRSALEDLPQLKQPLRVLVNLPVLDLGMLIRHGVYDPKFEGSFDLHKVHRTLLPDRAPPQLALADDEQVASSYRRLLNSRTRAKTRETVGADLIAYADAHARMLVDLYERLRA